MSKERRNFSRVDFSTRVSIEINGQTFEADLVDISLKGALLQTDNTILVKNNQKCLFEFRLDKTSIVMKTEAKIVFIKNNNLGIKFENIDLESMIHLRRLVELNMGDPDKIQKELSFLINS